MEEVEWAEEAEQVEVGVLEVVVGEVQGEAAVQLQLHPRILLQHRQTKFDRQANRLALQEINNIVKTKKMIKPIPMVLVMLLEDKDRNKYPPIKTKDPAAKNRPAQRDEKPDFLG